MRDNNLQRNFNNILLITLLGTICGANSWTEICDFAKAKIDWLKTFFKFPRVPSQNNFLCVYASYPGFRSQARSTRGYLLTQLPLLKIIIFLHGGSREM